MVEPSMNVRMKIDLELFIKFSEIIAMSITSFTRFAHPELKYPSYIKYAKQQLKTFPNYHNAIRLHQMNGVFKR